MTESTLSFESIKHMCYRLDELQKEAIISLKQQAYQKRSPYWSASKADYLARKILKEGFEQFEQRALEECLSVGCPGMLSSSLYHRSTVFLSPFSELLREIKDIILCKRKVEQLKEKNEGSGG